MARMARRKTSQGGLVYSSEQGRMCPACRKAAADCACSKTEEAPAGDGRVRVSRQTQGRKGKGVTVISGLPLNRSELAELGKQLKKRCGTGGTVKDGVIEIQGDRRDMLVDELQKRGFAAKKSGG